MRNYTRLYLLNIKKLSCFFPTKIKYIWNYLLKIGYRNYNNRYKHKLYFPHNNV